MGSEIVELENEEDMMMKWGESTSSFSSSPSSSSSSSFCLNNGSKQMPALSLNHVSFVCKSVSRSVKFYEQVLAFVLIKRPSSFDFEGAWLFNHGIGIHLLEAKDVETKKGKINPKDNHISFQTPDMGLIIRKLEEKNIEFVTAEVQEGGVVVDQLFFHDPDGYMIEICNCQNLPVLPLVSSSSSSSSSSCPLKKVVPSPTTAKQTLSSSYENVWSRMRCSTEVEALMMYLALDSMDISF